MSPAMSVPFRECRELEESNEQHKKRIKQLYHEVVGLREKLKHATGV